MFTRFKANVQRYPRTFIIVVVGIIASEAGSYITGRVMGITAKAQLHTELALAGIDLFLAAITYIWFMGDAGRVGVLLELLESIEGRKPEGNDPCEDFDEEVEQGCGDPDCDECNNFINDERGQDVAEYAIMLAVILAISIGVMMLVGKGSGSVFSQIGSSIQ